MALAHPQLQPEEEPPATVADTRALTDALQAILAILHQQARTDAILRAHLTTLGQALSAIAVASVAEAVPANARADDPEPFTIRADDQLTVALAPALAAPASPPATPDDIERLRRALQGHRDTALDEPPPRSAPAGDELPDEGTFLDALSSCCAAQAARIRQVQEQPGAPLAATDVPCDDWMEPLFLKANIPPTDWALLTGAYEAVATVVETLADVLDERALAPYRTDGFVLLAEAQSALRAAALRLRPRPDPSQEVLFQWLRRRAQAEGLYIKRYMRSDDVADPADWPARLARIGAWREDVEDIIYRRRHERKLVGKLRYQVRQVRRGGADEWPRALQTIAALLEHGTPPSSRLLRDLLLPHHAALLAERDRSRSIALMLRAGERHPAPPSSDQRADVSVPREEPQISQVADLLRNTTVVLIGGDERPRIAQIIEDAFDLRELVWCDTRPHQSHLLLEPAIARADVSVVLLAIRWASHGLGAVRTFCEHYQKPFVRLPGGYSVTQLAHQIMQQASERLIAAHADAASGDPG